jgi:hypothetical protein
MRRNANVAMNTIATIPHHGSSVWILMNEVMNAMSRNVPKLGRAPSGGPLVVIQETAESLTTTDGAHLVSRDAFNQLIAQPLMISFTMVVRHEFCDGPSEMAFRAVSPDRDTPP